MTIPYQTINDVNVRNINIPNVNVFNYDLPTPLAQVIPQLQNILEDL